MRRWPSRVKRAEAVRSCEAPQANLHDRCPLLHCQRTFGQRHGENLVWPNRIIVAPVRPVEHIKAAVGIRVPKTRESGQHALGQPVVLPSRLVEYERKPTWE